MTALSISSVRKNYGAVEVLRNIELELEEGGFLVLLGPSGCGKSTLLSMIAGLEDITAGEVRIGGRVVNDVKPKDRNIAMVFQSYALYPTMSVERNIGFGLEMRGMQKEERRPRVRSAAELLQIEHLLDRKPGALSGGQRQRVAMGRAIVRQPDLFLFDEPLSNLDAKLRVEMRTEIKRLHETLGTSIVYVTHDQVEAMTLGTLVAVMKDGVIQQLGTPQDIYDRPANLFVAGFIGSPQMNMIRGTLHGRGETCVLRYGAGGAAELRLEGLAVPSGLEGREVIVGIRPEAMALDRGHVSVLEGRVEMIEPTGPDTMVVVETEGQKVTVRVPPRAVVTRGQPIRIGVETEHLSLFDPETGQRLEL
ncbi:sn-glycerol-3-phosphate ABC transporter ATP-binding protein UgpC [Marinovum sp.]|uniref:ABC transporter ATP-binding protein n=1 Tax=Marinovum sp. TaxID=2024839 RepID=UPI002B26797E|nr:sn-glycerol-3-phosphate ABC transporter ATP-binding protein UgpC [Marinovum sp.]